MQMFKGTLKSNILLHEVVLIKKITTDIQQ